MSLTWSNLGYCRDQVGSYNEGWFAHRQAVLINPMNDVNRSNFYLIWKARIKNLSMGASLEDARRVLGDPDLTATGESTTIWTYGLAAVQFEQGSLVKIVD